MKPWAESFYNSDQWRACREAFLSSKGGLCERCSTPYDPVAAKIAHHKIWLTKNNINDPYITLSWDNLEALCQDCHNKEHHKKKSKVCYRFGEDGEILKVYTNGGHFKQCPPMTDTKRGGKHSNT